MTFSINFDIYNLLIDYFDLLINLFQSNFYLNIKITSKVIDFNQNYIKIAIIDWNPSLESDSYSNCHPNSLESEFKLSTITFGTPNNHLSLLKANKKL